MRPNLRSAKPPSRVDAWTWRLLLMSLTGISAAGLIAATLPAEQATQGMVATDHVLASRAGVEILAQGGNAVDAACASVFAVGVVNPAGSGIGGGGFMVISFPPKSQKEPVVLDFREVAPAAAHSKMYLKKGLSKHASRTGGLAVGVPGEVRGCAHAVKAYGKLPLKKVLAPAIRLAKEGFPIGHHLASGLKRYTKRLKKHKNLSKIFYPNGQPIAFRQHMTRPNLAKTLQAIADKGPKAFYRGWIAQDIVDAVKKAGGVLTLQDLKSYKIKIRQPLKTSYRGYTIYTMPPPSSGGVAIIQSLNILRRKSLKKLGHNSSSYLHLLAETLKHAFADRARFLGDPDFVKVPITKLTSQPYADSLYKRITDKAQAIKSYGMKQATSRAAHRGGGTSHLSTMDAFGMAVSVTSTINTAYGSKVVAPKSGVILNNQMDDFTTKPGQPNAFGLLQSMNNSIKAGKRPLSSMSPTIVLQKGKPVLAVGGSGGPTIITGTLQVMLNVLDFGLELNEAVSRGRVHHQWMPDLLFIESDLPKDVVTNLHKHGQRTKVFPYAFTAVQAVQHKGKRYYGASDPRKQGRPAGF